jgi:hypothetical protein
LSDFLFNTTGKTKAVSGQVPTEAVDSYAGKIMKRSIDQDICHAIRILLNSKADVSDINADIIVFHKSTATLCLFARHTSDKPTYISHIYGESQT